MAPRACLYHDVCDYSDEMNVNVNVNAKLICKGYEPPKKTRMDPDDISLWRNPRVTLRVFVEAIAKLLQSATISPSFWARTKTAITIATLCLFLHSCATQTSELQQPAIWLQETVLETLFWLGCGFLSTAGLGSGLQTGALFLFPHVGKLALHWSQQRVQSQSLSSLLWTAFCPGMWSGTGSALGELVPFILARFIRRAGGDPFALLNGLIDGADGSQVDEDEDGSSSDSSTFSSSAHDYSEPSYPQSVLSSSPSSPRPPMRRRSSSQLLLASTRDTMQDQLEDNAFWKIFFLAVVPNGVFDLAGLICGASDSITLWDFFLATWTAKALVRTPLQTCGLALAVVAIAAPESLPESLKPSNQSWLLRVVESWIQWGKDAVATFAGDGEGIAEMDSAMGGDSTLALVKGGFQIVWSLTISVIMVYFVASTVEQIAKHHVQTPQKEHCHSRAASSKKLL